MAQLSQLPLKSFIRAPSSNFHLLDCPKSSFFFFGKMAQVTFSCLLTSFGTISLHYIVIAFILACILKKSTLVNFCVAILILKMEEKQHFWHIIFITSRKVKMQWKCKKCVQCMENVL